jgi:GT2 family glycosyltransferase
MQPDFVIIGAMKCGTSTLAAQLAAQPGVFMTTPKEPGFFSHDEQFARGPDWYASLFKDAPPGALKGEASTSYTKLPLYPDAARRLHAYAPHAKLIYLTRDPLDRLVSHYIHEWTQNAITAPLDDAIRKHPELIDYSRYEFQLAPWREHFDDAQILCLTLEEMKAAPQRTLNRVAEFLGRSGQFHWAVTHEHENASAERLRRIPLQRLLIENPLSTWWRRTLVPLGFRNRIKWRLRMRERPMLSPEMRRYVLQRLEGQSVIPPGVGVVVIGRNEGKRLRQCLRSLGEPRDRIVYVDSGSTDDSVAFARSLGVSVATLPPNEGFSAGRARNLGVKTLTDLGEPLQFIQFLDGDCRLAHAWLELAVARLHENDSLVVVAGRRRELAPHASLFNRACDMEWNTPVGRAMAVGGDAMYRLSAFQQAGGFNPELICGEEPELCRRLRADGWGVERIDTDMSYHDAAMTRWRQWWRRCSRGGWAFMEGFSRWGQEPDRYNRRAVLRIALWGVLYPALLFCASAVALVSESLRQPAGILLLGLVLLAGLMLLRIARRRRRDFGDGPVDCALYAALTFLGKVPEAAGAWRYLRARHDTRPRRLIEYK